MALGSRAGLQLRPLQGPDTTRIVRPRGGRVVSASASQQHIEAVASESASNAQQQPASSRRALLGAAAFAAAALAPRAARADSYLLSTGAKGLLAEEEAKLLQLRQELEGDVRRELEADWAAQKADAETSGKLCVTPFGIDVVGITEFVALVGALVGGVTARQRKAELERLNEQLRKVNMSLRQQARAGMVYAPGLTYAPPAPEAGAGNGNGAAAAAAAAQELAAAPASERTLLSMDEDEMSADQIACRDSLRQGKRLLKEKNGAAAMVRFEKALMLSNALKDRVQERRAMRGLAASARLQGQYRAAIKHLERVLEISREMAEFTGDADAYGTIADCYTEMGDFEAAAANYDKYIRIMSTDGTPV